MDQINATTTENEWINQAAMERDTGACPPGSETYRVQRGDSFYLIARKFGVSVRALMNAKHAVIAAGGGGIAVLEQGPVLKGASAVIEKDLAAGKLAELLDADMLVILTSVDNVCLNYGQPDEKPLSTMTVAEAKKYMEQGQFGEGDMLPKIEAAINFIGDSAIRSVLITKLNKDGSNIHGGMGTMITK